MTQAKQDKVNLLYHGANGASPVHAYAERLGAALKRSGLLHYAFNAAGAEPPDVKELLRHPVVCIGDPAPPFSDIVQYLHGKQLLAGITGLNLLAGGEGAQKDPRRELPQAAELYDLCFTPAREELDLRPDKPCYWLPLWAATDMLGDHYLPSVKDKVGYLGGEMRGSGLLSRDTRGILLAADTGEQGACPDPARLCRAINAFTMLIAPPPGAPWVSCSHLDIAACNRLCFIEVSGESAHHAPLFLEDGKDAVFFRDFEELADKFGFYLKHDAELARIALSGFRTVRQFHSADVRARQLAERVLHHAAGKVYDADFNLPEVFAPSVAVRAFPSAAPVAKPFMDDSEVASIKSALQLVPAGSDVLEWGSGNSTLYFSQYLPPDSDWIAIEHNDGWAEQVGNMIRQDGRENVSLHMIPPDGPFLDGVEDGTFDSFRNYVLAPTGMDRQFGLIFVDGRARVACMAAGWPLLESSGIMVLHDAQRTEYHEGIPAGAYCLAQQHPRVRNGADNIATLFMAKEMEPVARLHALLAQSLPEVRLELFQYLGTKSTAAAPARGGAPSAVFINTYYGAFLSSFYRENPGLAGAGYQAQMEALRSSFFGDSDFYSDGLARQGWRCQDLIVNCEELQRAWARENDFRGSLPEIAVEQVRRLTPDVVYIQDMNICGKEFLGQIRPHARLIAGQIASPLPAGADLAGFDLIVSSFPHFVERFRKSGITSYYQPLAFEPRVLDAVPVRPFEERPIACSFVGGLSPMHGKGYRLMEHLARTTPIEFWGYGAETLPADSPIIPRHHGEVWGRAMFATLASSKITVNRHIDVADRFANNMRLFEATGCGALLITDYKENLDRLFAVGTEVVAYRSEEECAALVNYYLANPAEAAAIAAAGQRRTLGEHSYAMRMAQSAEFLQRHLRYRQDANAAPLPERISDGYQPISSGEVTPELAAAWKDPSIPTKQRALVQKELAAMYHGEPPLPYQVLARVLGPVLPAGGKLLEIGCASGYYYEVLEYLLNRRIDYTGVDYSDAMIAMARDYYPGATFFAADGACLFFGDRSFHTVISSCVLLHVPNYREHIRETARVASEHIVAARTPVCRRRPTRYMRKCAYGVETVELVFNEDELLREFALNGFIHAGGEEYSADPAADHYLVTYLFKRQ